MVLCETPWDMDSSMTWANKNHMGPYATSREPKHLDGTSTRVSKALTGTALEVRSRGGRRLTSASG